jgi:hypothetical protein
MKNILIIALMWPVGMLVGAMSITQIVIVSRFALPTCRELLDMGDMLSTAPVLRYRLSLLIGLVILIAASAVVWTWTGRAANAGFFTGMVIMALQSLGAVSPKHHRNNMMEFLESNRAYLSPGFLEKADAWASSGEVDSRLR